MPWRSLAAGLQPDRRALAHETLKDPYLFDFLGLGIEAHEREIENGLIRHITRFLLELGAGFAFVGRQFRLEVGGDDDEAAQHGFGGVVGGQPSAGLLGVLGGADADQPRGRVRVHADLREVEHVVEAETIADGMLFALPAAGLEEQREERRRTIGERCEAVAGLVGNTGKPALVWCQACSGRQTSP